MIFSSQALPLLGISVEQLILILYPTVLLLRIIQQRYRAGHPPKGYHRLGITTHSNVSDEFDERYHNGIKTTNQDSARAHATVKALFVYPVKSCAAIELETADIDGAGMLLDRKFAFAELLNPSARTDASESDKSPQWTIRTLRQPGYEKLVHVKPEIWLPQKIRDHDKDLADGGILVIRYPYQPSGPMASLFHLFTKFGFLSREETFKVPLTPPQNHRYPAREVTVWKDSPKWLDYGVHVPQSFRTYIGATRPLTLFRADPQNYRQVFRCAPRKEQLGYQPIVGFADAFLLHMLNLTSVRDIAEKVKNDIPKFTVRRFRPNILIYGPDRYDEDDWKRVEIGDRQIYCACHTIRCRLPNVDPDTSVRHPVEPDKTLKAYRCIDDGDPKNAAMGLQLVPGKVETIQIRVGDKVKVLERGKHRYIGQ